MVILDAETDHGRVATGLNAVHRIEVIGGQVYFVKPRRNQRTFANEVLASLIAPICGVPVCSPALVSLSQDFIDLNEDARLDFGAAGVYFGAIEETQDVLTLDDPDPELAATRIANLDEVYPIVAFDDYIANVDRMGNLGNLLLVRVRDREPAWEIRAIDHDQILTGPNWTVDDLTDSLDKPFVQVDERLHEWLQDREALLQSATRISDSRGRYALTVSSAPAELTNGDADAVRDFLEYRAGEIISWVEKYYGYIQEPRPNEESLE